MTEQTATTPAKFVPKIKGHVTLPQLKIVAGVFYYVKFLSTMALGKDIQVPDTVDPATGEIKKAAKREPATIAQVLNLETGTPAQIVCSTVFRKEIEEQFKAGSYVGKCFMFRITKVAGKTYNLVEISEIEDPTASAEATESAAPKAKAK